MGDFLDRTNDFGESLVAQRKWVSSRENDLVNARIFLQSGNGFAKPLRCQNSVRIRKMPSKTVPAVDRTGPGCDDECPSIVFLYEASVISETT